MRQILSIVLFALVLTIASCSTVALVLGHDRSSLLKKTLRSLAAANNSSSIPVYVSIDDNPKAARAIRAAEFEPNVSEVWHQPAGATSLSAREKIADHYHRALSKAFANTTTQNVIVIEDDLIVSSDFITFIQATLPYLSSSKSRSVVCASGWNDNAFAGAPGDEWRLTSFFPGLGWVLNRSLWEHLAPLWPHSKNTNTIVGTGWDFWLRILFDERNWTCITPRLSRVKHLGAGANVDSGASQMYASTTVATENADWRGLKVDIEVEMQTIQEWIDKGTLVSSITQALQDKPERPILAYRREEFSDLASQLGLWPTPRGHFYHTLWVVVEDVKVLLFDQRRAARHWRLPTKKSEISVLIRGTMNTSCDEVCQKHGYSCDIHALERGNDCDVLKREFGCRGCSFETGADLPAHVVPDAPLATAGWCLIAETGLGPRGELSCDGKFAWTERLCGCVTRDISSTSAAHRSDHDEL